MPTTTPDNIAYPAVGDPASVVTATSTLASSVQAALDVRQLRTYRWPNATAQNNQAGMSRGDLGYREDTDVTYRYSGSRWLNTASATYPMVPTAFSGGTLQPNGAVSFSSSSASTVNMDGVFTSEFERYRIDITSYAPLASVALALGLRSGGTTNTGAVYDKTEILGRAGAASSSTTAGGTEWGFPGAAMHKIVFDLSYPSSANPTFGSASITFATIPQASNTNNGILLQSVSHRTATILDGITFKTTGAGSGLISVQGLI